MADPRVSILIVAYKSRAHLPRLFDCLDAQAFRDFEAILIDNASPDGTDPDMDRGQHGQDDAVHVAL